MIQVTEENKVRTNIPNITERTVFNGVDESKSIIGLPEVNDDNYYDDRAYISNSMLGKLKESPKKLKDYLEGGFGESTSALSMGDAVHKGMLEPDKYKSEIVTWSEADFPVQGKTIRTKENRQWVNDLYKANPGKTILKDTEWMDVEGMLQSLRNKPEAMKWLDDAVYEQISLGVVNGLPMKSKGDIMRNDEWLIDLKTTSDIGLEAFKKSCDTYGYYRQAAMYAEMFGKTKFAFLIVEKKAPFQVAFYEVSDEGMERGRKELAQLIEAYKYYFLNDNDPMQLLADEAILKGVV